MPHPLPSSAPRLAELLRVTAGAFATEVHGNDPETATRLRTEIDCLLGLWLSGRIDPLAGLMDAAPPPSASDPSAILPLH